MGPLFRLTLILCTAAWLTACGNSVVVTPHKEGVVVTFRVTDVEEYKIRLTDPADDVNVGYTWHIDPKSVEFADITVEVCDGLPSDVEKGIITSERYCPWPAEVPAIDE